MLSGQGRRPLCRFRGNRHAVAMAWRVGWGRERWPCTAWHGPVPAQGLNSWANMPMPGYWISLVIVRRGRADLSPPVQPEAEAPGVHGVTCVQVCERGDNAGRVTEIELTLGRIPSVPCEAGLGTEVWERPPGQGARRAHRVQDCGLWPIQGRPGLGQICQALHSPRTMFFLISTAGQAPPRPHPPHFPTHCCSQQKLMNKFH